MPLTAGCEASAQPLRLYWAVFTPEAQRMFVFFSNRLGCFGSIVASVVGSAILVSLMYACSAR